MSLNIVIIGTNKGIGLEFARQYSTAGHRVFAICRQASDALKGLSCTVIEGIDVTDDKSVQGLAKALPIDHVDILIHNAGVLVSDTFPHLNMESMKKHFDINALGALRTVMALVPKLGSGSKVGIVSSRVGSIDDNTSANNYAYRVSKTAVNMIGKCLSIDLANDGIAVALLHPGYVRTQMTNGNGLIDASESAQGLIKRMDELSIDTSGIFVHTSGELLPW